jgi:hypothetical protein
MEVLKLLEMEEPPPLEDEDPFVEPPRYSQFPE